MNNIITLIKQYKCNNFEELKDVINFTDNINDYNFNEFELIDNTSNCKTKYIKIVNHKNKSKLMLSNWQLDIIHNRIL
jgi:hypothetical protein